MTNPSKCRICTADADQQHLRAEYVFGSKTGHKFWQCKACGLVYLYPIPSQEEEDQFYAQEFEKFMENRSGSDRNWSGPEAHIKTNLDQAVRRWEFLKDYIEPAQEVLEIGCSSGFMMDDLKTRGINVVGIEPSGGFGDFLTNRGHEHYNSPEELLEKTPDRKFDMVMHFFVLEHIRDTKAFLESQLALLKPGGWIVAEVPNVNDPLTSVYKIPAFEKFYWSIAHHYYFNPASLTQVLETIDCNQYHFVNEQRYDLSNHITWLQDGKPGGQGRFDHIFSNETLHAYKQDLIKTDHCDTFFLYIQKAL